MKRYVAGNFHHYLSKKISHSTKHIIGKCTNNNVDSHTNLISLLDIININQIKK